LEVALEQYPNHPDVLTARAQLGACYRQLADQARQRRDGPENRSPDVQLYYRAKHREYVRKAADAFQRLTADLETRSQVRAVSADEKVLLRNASFAEADCRFEDDDFQLALIGYEKLAERYFQQVEGLIACQKIWYCCGRITEPAQAREALAKARLALEAAE